MVNMVVTPANINSIRSTATELVRFGVKRFAATPVSLNVEYLGHQELLSGAQTLSLLDDLKWCSDNLGLEIDILEPLPKCFLPSWCWGKEYAFTGRSCQAGRMSISISNIGDVRPCSHNPIIYGNLFEDTLSKIWANMASYRDASIPVACNGCAALMSCGGACRTNSLAVTGKINEPDRLMVGHIDVAVKKQIDFFLKLDSVVNFVGSLRYRREGEAFSITSKKNGGNMTIVNEELFSFVCHLEKILPLSVGEIINRFSGGTASESFSRIIELLVKKEFICLK